MTTTDRADEMDALLQCDLDAAAALIEAYWHGASAEMTKLASSYRAGTHRQGVFPRAFMRHRLASTPPSAGEADVERVAMALAQDRGWIWENLTNEPAPWDDFDEGRNIWRKSARAAIAALAQHAAKAPVVVEPVAWEWRVIGTTDWIMQRAYPNRSHERTDIERRPLYAHPPATDTRAAALRTIADADPGRQSQQSLAHEMASIAKQALTTPPAEPSAATGEVQP